MTLMQVEMIASAAAALMLGWALISFGVLCIRLDAFEGEVKVFIGA